MAEFADLIRTDKPLLTKGWSEYPYKPILEKKYRFTSRFGDEILLHEVDKEKGVIRLPRGLCPIGEVDQRDWGQDVTFIRGPEPRPNQVDMFDAIENMAKLKQSGLVIAYTGFGKTVLGYKMAFELQKKTLVITTKDDIYKQWLTGAEKFLGLEPHEIGEIRQDKCEVIDTKFCVAMIHSLSSEGKYPDWIVNDFGLVIFDECHRVPADSFSAVAGMFPAAVRMGLTATLERSDGKELLIQSHVGPVRAATEAQLMVPKVLRYNTNWACPRRASTNPVTGATEFKRIPHQAGKTAHIEKMVAADPERNHLIADIIKTVYEKGRKIVVFSTLIDHLQSMHRCCIELKISGKEMGFYIGATTKADKEAREKVKVKPIIFTTFSMMAEGTDIPWLDTCLLAMPRSRVEQPVGRVRREYEGKPDPIVIDMMDFDSPVFSGYVTTRRNWYKSIGAKVVDMD